MADTDWEIGGFLSALKTASIKAETTSKAAVRDVAEYVLAESIQEVPVLDHDLQRSGEVRELGGDGEISCAVFYDTPYAVVQHEDMTFNHKPGRKAKYLEDPMNAVTQGPAQALIARHLKGA